MEKVAYTQIDIVLTGRKIHSVLLENGCKVRQLQEILKLSCPQPIYRWINGKTLPTVDNLYMMHRVFGMHMEDMLVARDVGKD
ncbi:MAG: helix-turn-helix transcriptional regulator [Eubacterium sp.]|nr:helix-turn-helix transcriptional regulator [Eubacterium sp.]